MSICCICLEELNMIFLISVPFFILFSLTGILHSIFFYDPPTLLLILPNSWILSLSRIHDLPLPHGLSLSLILLLWILGTPLNYTGFSWFSQMFQKQSWNNCKGNKPQIHGFLHFSLCLNTLANSLMSRNYCLKEFYQYLYVD